jgi:uncharacterized protein (TIGR03089 family)
VRNQIIEALGQAVRSRGSAPLLTWYAPASQARTELSVRSFANWVDKTANLLASWDLSAPQVRGAVSHSDPGHWMSLIWPLAVWQAGGSYTTLPTDGADVVVIGPHDPTAITGSITVACSLHPLGLGLRDLPDGVLDFSSEALVQSDAHYATNVEPTQAAWTDSAGVRSHGGLAVAPSSQRVLVRPSDAWQTLAEAVLAPLLGGGSAVVVDGELSPDALARLVASERISTPVA